MNAPASLETSAAGGAVAAFFDVDGTLVDANIVDYWIWLSTRDLSPARRTLWLLARAPRFLRMLAVDRISRTRFNRDFYRSYRGWEAESLDAGCAELFEAFIRPRVFAEARERLEEHRRRGERLILVSGSLDVIVAPLASFLGVDDSLSVSLEVRNGRATGELMGPPLGEEQKARAVRDYAARRGIDLARSWAYGDSAADLPLLEAVGRPVVVNGDARLRRIGRKRAWPHVEWAALGGSGRA